MPKPQNLMEVFKHLDKSNCQQCLEKTCLAFAAAVFKGQKTISECPKVPSDLIDCFAEKSPHPRENESDPSRFIEELKRKISEVDLSSRAEALGGIIKNGRLLLKVLGKDFAIDSNGNLYSDIHINPWVTLPFLTYIALGKGTRPSGKWLPFRELKEGKSGAGLFRQRCEKAVKTVADRYTDLFETMIILFNGKQAENIYQSDISLVLWPLPRVPILYCYWKPDEGLESSLNVFFDETVTDNLTIGAIFGLAAGLARMFESLAARHGHNQHPFCLS